MDSSQSEPRVLQELAYVYIALAHGTDDHLSDEEIDQIATRLRGWEIDAVQTVTSALKEALDLYLSDSSTERLDRAVTIVRDAFPEENRTRLMDDLVEIAMADGKFLSREGSFIDRVARVLDAHMDNRSGTSAVSWSLLGGSASRDGWSPIHDLALIYVTLAHRTDDDLSTAEIEVIARRLNEWLPDASEDDILHIVQDVLGTYSHAPTDEIFGDAVESVRNCVPAHQLPVLLDDLRDVAAADGRIIDEEERVMTLLARAWHVQTTLGAHRG